MPLGVTLADMRRDLRAETGTTLNPAQGVQAQASIDLVLARQQRELWDAYNWQHLKVWEDIALVANQEGYDYPKTMKFDQIRDMWVATEVGTHTNWRRLAYGIRANMYGFGPKSGTPTRWATWAAVNVSGPEPITDPIGQFYIFPVPPTAGMYLRIEGQAPINRLVADTDICIIDSHLIVLFAAAEIMATQKSEVAPMKLTKAQNYLRRLLANQGADKRINYNMGGNHRGGNDPDKGRRMIPYIDYVPG